MRGKHRKLVKISRTYYAGIIIGYLQKSRLKYFITKNAGLEAFSLDEPA